MSDREEFELWFDKATDFNYGVAYYVEINGAYCFDDINLAWEAWQAARSEAYVLRKQAEALEDQTIEWGTEELTYSGRNPHKELTLEAEQLRQEVGQLEQK